MSWHSKRLWKPIVFWVAYTNRVTTSEQNIHLTWTEHLLFGCWIFMSTLNSLCEVCRSCVCLLALLFEASQTTACLYLVSDSRKRETRVINHVPFVLYGPREMTRGWMFGIWNNRSLMSGDSGRRLWFCDLNVNVQLWPQSVSQTRRLLQALIWKRSKTCKHYEILRFHKCSIVSLFIGDFLWTGTFILGTEANQGSLQQQNLYNKKRKHWNTHEIQRCDELKLTWTYTMFDFLLEAHIIVSFIITTCCLTKTSQFSRGRHHTTSVTSEFKQVHSGPVCDVWLPLVTTYYRLFGNMTVKRLV